MALASAEYTGDAVHLLRLIESQPSCVMRVGVDGTLLAVNDAALKLLGAPGLETVLGTSLSDRLASRSGPVWQEFVSRLQGGASSSVECALTQGSIMAPLDEPPKSKMARKLALADRALHALETWMQPAPATADIA